MLLVLIFLLQLHTSKQDCQLLKSFVVMSKIHMYDIAEQLLTVPLYKEICKTCLSFRGQDSFALLFQRTAPT